MSMPFYVSPEQLMKDRADFARKGIARGRSVAVIRYADGVLFVSENPSAALHKISEIYDRIAFAAVGRYNEFENLRIAGVRLADMRGYSYDRRDVTGRGLANAYAQTLGTIFSSGGEKPYEIEIFVAEVGDARRRRPDLPADLRRPGRRGARLRGDGWRGRGRDDVPPGALRAGPGPQRGPDARGRGPRAERDGSSRRAGPRPRGGGARPHPHPGAQVQAAGRPGAGRRPRSGTASRRSQPRRARAAPPRSPPRPGRGPRPPPTVPSDEPPVAP